MRQLPREAFATSSAVIVDAGNYYPSRDGHIAEIDSGLTDSEWVSRVLGCRVVKAFNNIVAPNLASRGVPAGAAGRVCRAVAGDEASDKQVVLGLIDAVGFDGLDAGTPRRFVAAAAWHACILS